MEFSPNNTYFGYETYMVKERERKALKRTALAVGLSILIYFAASFAVANVITQPVSALLDAAATVEIYDVIYECYKAIIYSLPLLLATLPFIFIVRIPMRVALPMKRTPVGTMIPCTMMGLGCSSVGVTVASVLLSLFMVLGLEYNVPDQPVPETTVGIILYLIVISVLPALIEEILFRGFILQSLRRFGDMFAVIISALIFALYHGNFAQIPNAFILGVVIAFIAVRTGSLVTGMILHFLNNFVITVLDIFVLSKVNEIIGAFSTLLYLGVYFVLGVIGAVILAAKQKGFFSLKKSDSPLTTGERCSAFLFQPVAFIGMLLMLGFCFVFFVK